MNTQAQLTVHGPSQLRRAFRKRLLEALRQEAPEVKFTETPDAGHLAFSLDAANGIPFPQLIEISTHYPDCVATVQWTQLTAQGETTIQNGQVQDAARAPALPMRQLQYLRLAPDQGLVLGLTIDLHAAGLLGFCATADAETFFKSSGEGVHAQLLTIGDAASGTALAWDELWPPGTSACRPIDPAIDLEADERRSLEALAAGFRAQWLWYRHAPEEDIIVECQRYAEANRQIHAINVKSRQLADGADLVRSNLGADQEWIVARLLDTWARG